MKELRYSLIDGITDAFNDVTVVCLGILIGYLIFIGIIGAVIWGRFLIYLKNLHLKVKQMLAIIPLELVLKVKQIQNYFEDAILKT